VRGYSLSLSLSLIHSLTRSLLSLRVTLGCGGETSSFLLSSLELNDTKSLCALNTSPPRNRCTFLRVIPAEVDDDGGAREGVLEAERLISQVLVPLFQRVPLREGELLITDY